MSRMKVDVLYWGNILAGHLEFHSALVVVLLIIIPTAGRHELLLILYYEVGEGMLC